MHFINPIVKDYLETLNNTEIEQRQTGKFIFDYPHHAMHENVNNLTFYKKYFLKDNKIFVGKHNRFAAYPLHNHEFFEFNYMLKGSCKQVINNEVISLHTGDLMLLDTNCYHSIEPLSENDILINIIFPYESLETMWMNELSQKNNVLFNFLMSEMSFHSKGNYVLFDTKENTDAEFFLCQIINKYYTDNFFSTEILRFLIPVLFMELIGNTPYHFKHPQKNLSENHVVAKSLNLISEHYFDLTLDKVSKVLCYNKNYLSNLITKKTGLTFTEHLNNRRLEKALFLIKSTSIPIREISEQIGIENKTYFYKIFKAKFGRTPSKYR
jgi:AraC-like DNA-binding protein